MIRRPPRSTRTDTLFPYTTLFRSTARCGRPTMTSIECGLTEHLFMIRSIQGRFSMTDQAVRYFEPFDLDVTLRDAALDDQNRPPRRMLANAAIGMHVEDAYYSMRELRAAVSWIH